MNEKREKIQMDDDPRMIIMIKNANNGDFEHLFENIEKCFWVKNLYGEYIGLVILMYGFKLYPQMLPNLWGSVAMERVFRDEILPYLFDMKGRGKVRIECDTDDVTRLAEKLGFNHQPFRRWFVLTRKRYYREK